MPENQYDPLTEEEAEEMLVRLSEHYRQPVMPIGRYCDRLKEWFRIMSRNVSKKALDAAAAASSAGKPRPPFHDPYRRVLIDIRKSSLLARTLYGGETLRTEQCPVHKGTWSGCRPGPCPHHCGSDLEGRNGEHTGWIAPDAPC